VDSLSAVELLLQNRAEVGKRDAKGRSCLHYAAMLDRGRCAEVLILDPKP
jgi:ankyrin repeat protein